MFAENGWEVPTTWSEFTALCDEIKESGTLPLYLGFKDTWTCLAPWNALAVGLCDSDTCNQVNMGNMTFEEAYSPVADKIRTLLDYAEDNPYAYSYNDACTAFARGESAMYTIGSYAIPQIKSVNPDMNIGSFTFPANDNEADNVLNSGIDLQFSVMKACKNKEAAYEVLEYLYSDETIQTYLDDQGGIACKDGDFAIPDTLEDMQEYIKDNRMSDYQDHHYPSEMSVDAMIQTYLLDTGDNAKEKFLKKFDSDADASDFGLDEPQNVVKLSTDDKAYTITIGEKNAMLGEYYIKVNDDVYLSSTTILGTIPDSIDDMIATEDSESTETESE